MSTEFKFEIDEEVNAREFPFEIRVLKHYVREWAKVLELNKWFLRVRFATSHPEEEEIYKKSGKLADVPSTRGDIDCDFEYRSAKIVFYLSTIQDRSWGDEEDFWEVASHEMWHTQFMPIVQIAQDLLGTLDADEIMSTENRQTAAKAEAVDRIHEMQTTIVSELDVWEKIIPIVRREK